MKLESALFNTENFTDEEERLELYQQNIGGVFDVVIDRQSIRDLKAEIKSYCLDNIIFVECASIGQIFKRDEKKIASSGIDHFIVQIFLSGNTNGQGIHEGKCSDASSIFFIDSSRPWVAYNPSFRNLSLAIPRLAIRERVGGLAHLHGLNLPAKDNPFAKLFINFVLNLYQQITLFERDSAELLSRNSIDLLTSALIYHDRGKFSEADKLNLMGMQIKQFIESNISNPNLNIQMLIEKFSISRSSLYRLFPEQNGGLGQYIKIKRMNKAYLKLMQKGVSKNISEIAYDCGFKSSASFSRAFRDHFHHAPKELTLELKKTSLEEDLHEHLKWHNWLKMI